MAGKIRTFLKWPLIVIGVLLVVFVAAIIAIPYFYKDDILDAGKGFANEQINATLDFDNDKVGLSLLWTFPNLSFSIGELSVTGHDEFEGKKLADIGEFYFTINVTDAISGNYNINGVTLSDADLWVKVLRNGKANYDIMKPSDAPVDPQATEETTTSGGKNMKLKIKYWAIENTNIIYDDVAGTTYVELKNLNHSGSGDFSLDNVELYSETTIDEFTVSMDRVRYLKRAKVNIDFNADIDLAKGIYKIMDNKFQFNALTLNLEGQVEMLSDDIKMDLKFSTPNTSFASVLSMIPSAFTKDFSGVKTKGSFKLTGFAKGIYNEKGAMPAFSIDLGVKDGEFKYPDLPLPVQDINTQIAVKSSSSDFDKMTIDVTQFHIKIGKNPFDAMLKLRTPLSDPDIDTKIDGTIDLGELSKAFPMEGVSEFSGIIKANLEAKTKMSYVNNSEYDKIEMKGLLGVSKMNYNADGLPPVKINNMAMEFTPNNVILNDFDLKIGKSDIRASGTLDNILTYFSRDKIMKGNLVVNSNLLDLNEIESASGGDTDKPEENKEVVNENLATAMEDTTAAVDEPIFDRFDFAMDMNFKEIKYDVHEIKNMAAKGTFSPSTAVLENFEMLMGKVDIQAKGELNNVFGYLFDGDILKGTLTLYSKYMNLNQFMSEDGEAVEQEAITEVPEDLSAVESDLEPMQIPGNIDFALFTTFKELIYDSYNLKNVQAEVHVHHHTLDINALRADVFGGSMAMNGQYDTKDPNKPKFKLAYDMSKLDIQTIAKKVGLSKRFLPILESIYGQFNSEFQINGILDENMYPDLTTLFAKGSLKTFNTVVKNNPSVNKLSDQLKMATIKNLDLGNTNNFFTIKDGKLKIDPATYQVEGMDIIFGGTHGLDNSMDYDMKLRVPRALLAKNPVGAAANNALGTGLAALSGEAKKMGVDLEISEFLNIGVGVTGTVTKPKFKIKLLGGEGKGGESLGGQAAALIKAEAEKLKAAAEAKIKEEADRLRAEGEARLKAETDRLKKAAEDKAKKLAAQAAANPGSVVDSLKKIDPSKVDPTKVLDPSKLGGLFGKDKDKKEGDKKEGDKKKNPFGKFKNPFGPK